MDFSESERWKGSIIHLERGVALAQLSREGEAISAFTRALIDAQAGNKSKIYRLEKRMADEANPAAQALWKQALRSENLLAN